MSGGVPSIASENFAFQKIVAVLSVVLLVVKFSAWVMTSSVAILTDALESIVNVVAAFVGLYALYLSSLPRNKTFPFGHGKVELISSLVEGAMIVAAGGMIIFEAVKNIMEPNEITSLDLGLVLIALTAVANFVVGYAAIRRGRKNRSMALVASGKHLCSDTLSSAGVILGLVIMMVFSNAGYDVAWVDSMIAIIFGSVILFTGARVVKKSLEEVMDRADEDLISEMVEIISEGRHEHWVDVHGLRITKYGTMIHIEFHMVLPRHLDILEQQREFDEINNTVKSRYGDGVELIIQGEPCTYEFCSHCEFDCPHRRESFVCHVEWDRETATEDKDDPVISQVDE